jgi:anaerobic glycerol-3-phosphate dehydrogenase
MATLILAFGATDPGSDMTTRCMSPLVSGTLRKEAVAPPTVAVLTLAFALRRTVKVDPGAFPTFSALIVAGTIQCSIGLLHISVNVKLCDLPDCRTFRLRKAYET